jgi:aminopeptidase N
MIEFLEGRFGPYPFAGEKYGHVTFEWRGAMEHQTVTSFGDLFYDAWDLLDGDRIMLHEVAHQWFGNSLGPSLWQDIWLNEGFASYCEALWVENNEGTEAYLANMRGRQRIELWQGQGPVFDPMPVFPGNVIYDKGAWILHMLRGRLGDEAFFALLQEYATGADRPFGTVTTAGFIALAQDHAGDDDLTVFFDRWLEETVVPRIVTSQKVIPDPGGGPTVVELTLQQRQTPLFDNVFPVQITTADNGVSVEFAHLFQEKQMFSFEVDGEVVGVKLDPDRWVLWSSLGSPDPFVAYPNPLQKDGPGVSFQVLDLEGEASLDIYDARGRLVHRSTAEDSPLFWNGRDRQGRTVASGVYWAAVEFDGRRVVEKFTVVR